MKDKNIKNLFLQETAKIDVKMSEKLKNTPIQSSKQENSEIVIRKKFNWQKLFVPITSVIFPLTSTASNAYLTAYILEINPTVELTGDGYASDESTSDEEENISIAFVTDENDKMIKICSVNEDANEILSSEEFNDISNINLDEAIEKVIKYVKRGNF